MKYRRQTLCPTDSQLIKQENLEISAVPKILQQIKYSEHKKKIKKNKGGEKSEKTNN